MEVQRSADGGRRLVLDDEEKALLDDLSDWLRQGAGHEVSGEFAERLFEFVERFSSTMQAADEDLGGGEA